MITAQDAESLAIELYKASVRSPGNKACYLICPSAMTAALQSTPGEAPMMTGHGSATELGRLIHSYHQWGQPIRVGMVLGDGLFQFWIENDGDL